MLWSRGESKNSEWHKRWLGNRKIKTSLLWKETFRLITEVTFFVFVEHGEQMPHVNDNHVGVHSYGMYSRNI